MKKTITGIIGYPLSHTLSPLMHNSVFKKYGMNWEYIVMETRPELVQDAVSRVRKEGMRGINVTIPHKHAVMPFLDKIDRAAKTIGAVNTVVNNKGVLTGYNTDYLGFMATLNDEKINLKGKNVIMIGAGGAAHAIGYAIKISKPKQFRIFNIDEKMTAGLVKKLGLKGTLSYNIKKTAAQDELVKNADFIINCTSVGMHGNEIPYDIDALKKGAFVYDIIYNPEMTPLLKRAKKLGARTKNGLDMLIYQGMEAFKLWTGRKSDYALIKRKLNAFFRKK